MPVTESFAIATACYSHHFLGHCPIKMAAFDLKQFDVCDETGFVPREEPEKSLPDKFKPWEEVVAQLPVLLSTNCLRKKAAKLPLVLPEELSYLSEREWWRAYVLLCYICHAYIWGEGEKNLVSVLPENLSIPWCAVAKHLDLPPVVTHAAVVLHNWRKLEPSGPLSGDNMRIYASFTGTEDENWFSIATALVELEAAKGIRVVPRVFQCITKCDDVGLPSCLGDVKESINLMEKAISRMKERCRPAVFYSQLRQYLAGWKGNSALPEGLVYKGVSEVPVELSGGSAAQSSAVVVFDTLLGVEHHGAEKKFLQTQRAHMPPKHREFLEEMQRQPSLIQYVHESRNTLIKLAYNDCIKALVSLRSEHIRIVSLYIVVQSGHSAAGMSSLQTTGTGGTGFISFLKNVRRDTENAFIA